MNNQIVQAITFVAFFVASKVGKPSLSPVPTVDVREGDTLIATDQNATEIGGGLYRYTVSSGSVDAAANYTAVFKTSDTSVDQQHLPALWVIGAAWVEHLDEDVSAVLAAVEAVEVVTSSNVSFYKRLASNVFVS